VVASPVVVVAAVVVGSVAVSHLLRRRFLGAGASPSPPEVPGAAAEGAGLPSEGIGPHLCRALRN
jgi:hypothetical protein